MTNRVVSLPTKIRQVTGLAGTLSVDRNTNEFLENIEVTTDDGRNTSGLTAGQIAWIERIFEEFFA